MYYLMSADIPYGNRYRWVNEEQANQEGENVFSRVDFIIKKKILRVNI